MSLLQTLREATSASHETLDAAFGSLDLSSREDYVRFLRGHAIGLAPLFGSFRQFVEGELDLSCPDYPAMLQSDLAALGEDPSALPQAHEPAALRSAATSYVIAGSRLGLAMIRKNGYWGRAHQQPSAYMEDDQGLAIWKHLAARLKEWFPDEEEAAGQQASAIVAFETFREAFAISALAPTR